MNKEAMIRNLKNAMMFFIKNIFPYLIVIGFLFWCITCYPELLCGMFFGYLVHKHRHLLLKIFNEKENN